jgi:hypothetical protein
VDAGLRWLTDFTGRCIVNTDVAGREMTSAYLPSRYIWPILTVGGDCRSVSDVLLFHGQWEIDAAPLRRDTQAKVGSTCNLHRTVLDTLMKAGRTG